MTAMEGILALPVLSELVLSVSDCQPRDFTLKPIRDRINSVGRVILVLTRGEAHDRPREPDEFGAMSSYAAPLDPTLLEPLARRRLPFLSRAVIFHSSFAIFRLHSKLQSIDW